MRAAARSSSVGVMPLAPLASRVTVSLVDMQPSESSRSNETRVARLRARSATSGGTAASVVSTTSMVAGRCQHAGALGHATHGPAGPLDDDLLADRVGGHDRVGGRAASVVRQCARGRVDTVEQVLPRVAHPDQPGRAHHHVDRATADPLGDPLGHRVRRCEAVRTRVAVGTARVEHDGTDGAVLDDLLAPQHRVRLAAVRGEDRGGVVARPVVDDEGQVLRAAGLQTRGDRGGAETLGMGDAHSCSSDNSEIGRLRRD